MARKIGTRKVQSPTITVIGEGITEQYYLQHIRKLYDYRYSLKPNFFGIQSLTKIGEKIKTILEGNGIAVAVFDADVAERVPAEKEKLTMLKAKYEKNKNVIFCDTCPSIEYWFLLHYCCANKTFNNADALKTELRKYITTYEKSKKFLEEEKWVSDMCNDGKFEKARNNASKFGIQENASYSNIYLLFKHLDSL